MNKKNVITIYLLLITIIVLVVPFQYSIPKYTGHRSDYYCYSFLLKPPVRSGWNTEIIYSRIGLELIAVSAICGILYLNTKNKE